MKATTQQSILQVLACVSAMPVGQGWARLSFITAWAGASKQTVWRYLPKMERLRLVERETRPYRQGELNYYRITLQGMELLEAYHQSNVF